MCKRILFLGLFYLSFFNSFAQETGEDDMGLWTMYFGTHRVSEMLSFHSEMQYRTYELPGNFNQLLLRTGLNYHFSKNAAATFGYGYISTDPTFENREGERKNSEHRIFEQLVIKNNIGKFMLSHRYRLEQRFLDNAITGTDTQHRIRYLMRITYPVTKSWFLTAYDEIFVNLEEPIFGQNRLYGALGYKATEHVSLQFGYLKNHFTGRNFDRLQIGIWWNTDLSKKTNENPKL